MSIGFDGRNLAGAVKTLMQLAAELKTEHPIVLDDRKYDTADEAQVTDYLMTKAQEIYDRGGPGHEWQIHMDHIYKSLGVMYAPYLAELEMHPEPVTRAPGRPQYLVSFWQVL